MTSSGLNFYRIIIYLGTLLDFLLQPCYYDRFSKESLVADSALEHIFITIRLNVKIKLCLNL